MKLRQPQIKTLNSLAKAILAGKRKIVVQAPTGFGKTVVAARIVAGHRQKGGRPIFVCPAVSLIDQTVERLVEYGIPLSDIGVIQADHPMTDYSRPVQVASIQTLSRRNVNHLDASLVLVDECHKVFKAQIKWMDQWNAVPFIGLSATPWTKGLGEHWEELVCETTIGELIRDKHLSPYRVFAASHPDLTGVRTQAGDYHEGDLSEAMQRGAIVGDTVRHWLKHAEGRPTLAFCVDRAHAKHMQAEFISAGVSAGYVDAYTDREERQEISEQFHRGDLAVVCSVGCLTTGVDWDVRCIILARPTKSPMLYVQIIGRGLRTADDKDDCLILDHSDTTLRLGFPEDVEAQHTALCDGKITERNARERDEPLPKPCGSCGFIKPPKTHKCPACGFAPEKQSEVETFAAELEELTPKAQRKANRQYSNEQKREWYAGLQQIAYRYNYKSGWASHQYKQKFGVWPNAHKDVKAAEPTTEVLSWVRSQQIRYAKRRQAA